MHIKVTKLPKLKRRRYPITKKLSFEEALEKLIGKPSVIEGQIPNRQTIQEFGYGTEDKGYIPDPSFMLHPRARRSQMYSPKDLPPRLRKIPRPALTEEELDAWYKAHPPRDIYEGMESVRKKAKANILEDMSLEDIFGELMTSHQVSHNSILNNIKNLELSESGTGRMKQPSEATLKDFFSDLLARERIRFEYPLDVPEM
jgi:hypothetical protein